MVCVLVKLIFCSSLHPQNAEKRFDGGLAQLARALPWHGRGHRFDSDILHYVNKETTQASGFLFIF